MKAILPVVLVAALTGASAARRDMPRPPALNHIYVVLDAATFAAIRDSRAVAHLLGRSDGGLPDHGPPAPGADRIFFRGRHTYLELFAPENRFGEPVGKVGIGLGHDRREAFAALERAWRSSCGGALVRSAVSFERVRPPVPWYDAWNAGRSRPIRDLRYGL